MGALGLFVTEPPKYTPTFKPGQKNNQYHGKLALDRWALLDMPNLHREPEKNLTSSHVERKGHDHFNFTQFITYEKIYNKITSKICLPICSVLHFCLLDMRLMDYYCSQRTHRSMKFTTKILPTSIYIYIKSILCKKYVPRVNTYLKVTDITTLFI